MIIENIRMMNFLSHRDSDIYLGKGINIILGQNGSGKSSIFEAMKVAFFGQAESERRRIVSYGESLSKISVKFRIGSHEYEIKREIENKKERETTKSALLTMDGEILAEGSTAVSSEIQNLMGISKSAFINSIYVDQGQIDSLVRDSPAERKDIFNEIIGLKNYDRAFDEIDSISRKLSAEIAQIDFMREQKRNTEKEITAINCRIRDLENKQGEMQKNIENQKETTGEIQRKYEEFLRLSTLMESKRNKISELHKSIGNSEKKRKDLETGLGNIEQLRNRIRNLESDPLYVYGDRLAIIDQNINMIIEARKEIDKLLGNKKRLENSREKLGEEEGKQKVIQEKVNEITEKEREMEELRPKKYAYDNFAKEMNDLNSQKNSIMKKRSDTEKSIPESIWKNNMTPEDVEGFLKGLREEENELNGKIMGANALKSKYNSEIKLIKTKIEELKNVKECPLCGQELSEDHHRQVINQYNEDMGSMEEQMRGGENLISACNKKLSRIRDEIVSFSSQQIREYFTLSEKLSQILEILTEKEKGMKELEEVSKKFQTLESSLKYDIHFKDDLARSREIISGLNSIIKSLEDEDIDSAMKRVKERIDDLEKKNNSSMEAFNLWTQGRRVSDYDAIRKERDKSNQILNAARGKEDELNALIGILSSMQSEREKIENEIISLNSQVANYEDIAGKRDRENNLLEELREESGKITSELTGLRVKEEDLKTSIEQTQKNLEEMERSKKIYDFLMLLKKGFSRDGIPQIIRKMALEVINSITRNIISRFNLNIDDIGISEDLDVEIMQNGYVKNITQLSGGEKTAVSIAMRLAIAKYLGRNISTIMMDEPTVYLDEERRNDLREILQYSMKDLSEEGVFPQIVIITHHPELETAADISLHVTKSNGLSVVENASY
ncbi:MAG: AAA family ATPase [Cuniculiplasma sp.]